MYLKTNRVVDIMFCYHHDKMLLLYVNFVRGRDAYFYVVSNTSGKFELI